MLAGVVPDPASWAASVDTVTMGNKVYQTKGPRLHCTPVQEWAKPKQPIYPSTCKVEKLRSSVRGFW